MICVFFGAKNTFFGIKCSPVFAFPIHNEKNKSFKCKSTLKDTEIYKPESKRIKKQSKKSQNHYWTTAKYFLLNSLCNCLNF